eukprot:TRINITY_DN14428_c0_g1_i1.p1 TRINITY_DN14428_c0_g1~~TRINITY_DN14428_c0_g1_i1.p1  ORF type:complete len:819 (-),score=252.71 TRINITY_DN14428_c0_g1_i1:579-3035(-)
MTGPSSSPAEPPVLRRPSGGSRPTSGSGRRGAAGNRRLEALRADGGLCGRGGGGVAAAAAGADASQPLQLAASEAGDTEFSSTGDVFAEGQPDGFAFRAPGSKITEPLSARPCSVLTECGLASTRTSTPGFLQATLDKLNTDSARSPTTGVVGSPPSLRSLDLLQKGSPAGLLRPDGTAGFGRSQTRSRPSVMYTLDNLAADARREAAASVGGGSKSSTTWAREGDGQLLRERTMLKSILVQDLEVFRHEFMSLMQEQIAEAQKTLHQTDVGALAQQLFKQSEVARAREETAYAECAQLRRHCEELLKLNVELRQMEFQHLRTEMRDQVELMTQAAGDMNGISHKIGSAALQMKSKVETSIEALAERVKTDVVAEVSKLIETSMDAMQRHHEEVKAELHEEISAVMKQEERMMENVQNLCQNILDEERNKFEELGNQLHALEEEIEDGLEIHHHGHGHGDFVDDDGTERLSVRQSILDMSGGGSLLKSREARSSHPGLYNEHHGTRGGVAGVVSEVMSRKTSEREPPVTHRRTTLRHQNAAGSLTIADIKDAVADVRRSVLLQMQQVQQENMQQLTQLVQDSVYDAVWADVEPADTPDAQSPRGRGGGRQAAAISSSNKGGGAVMARRASVKNGVCRTITAENSKGMEQDGHASRIVGNACKQAEELRDHVEHMAEMVKSTGALQLTEMMRRIVEIERHGNIKIDYRNGDVELVREIPFVPKKATEDPTGEFVDAKAAEMILQDVAKLWDMFKVPISVIGRTKGGNGDFWQRLSMDRGRRIKKMLETLGVNPRTITVRGQSGSKSAGVQIVFDIFPTF